MEREEGIYHMINEVIGDNHQDHMDIAIPKFISNKVVAYQSMREDLLWIKDSINQLANDNLQPSVNAAIWYSAIAIYGRCFTDAEKSKYPKLETQEIFKENDSLRTTHDELMELRHNFVSHRGETSHEVSLAFMRISFKDNNYQDTQIITKQLRQNKPNSALLNKVIELIDYLLPLIEKKYAKAAQKANKAMLENFTDDELTKMRIT